MASGMAWTTRPQSQGLPRPFQTLNVPKDKTHALYKTDWILSTISWCVVSRPCCSLLNRSFSGCLNRPRPSALCCRFEQDYGNDSCINHFTEGQAVRMAAMWNAYREGATPEPTPAPTPTCDDDNDCTGGEFACATGTCENDGTCSYDENSCKGIFEFTLVTDKYPAESSWEVKDECDGNKVVLSGGSYLSALASYVERAEIGYSRFTLTVNDSYGG